VAALEQNVAAGNSTYEMRWPKNTHRS